MIVIKCPMCGKKVVWDDYQPMQIKCPKCRHDLDVRSSYKENIRVRVEGEGPKIYRCPKCKALIRRRWFVQCGECGRFILGPVSFSGKWPFVLAVTAGYLAVTAYYWLYVR